MVNITPYLRCHVKDSGTGIVWISFYVSREKINFSTGIKCEVKNWSKLKLRITAADSGAKDKNLIIENMIARCNDVFVKFRLRNRKLTRDAFLREYHRPSDYSDFFGFVSDYQKKTSYRKELSTLHTHNSVINKVREFRPNLHFDDITHEFIDEYYVWLRYTKNNNDNTAMKNIAIFKGYVLGAIKAGYIDDNPFTDWKIRNCKANFVYLTEDELQILLGIYKRGELEPKLHKTLEVFLFLCFSSLHIGDAKALKLEQFNAATFHYFRIKLRNIKPTPIVVPISEPLRIIMRNMIGTRKQGFILDNLPGAEQTMNRWLKEIAEIARIPKKITLKSGRHTFATIYLAKTKDITALKEILGHSQFKETLVYAHVLDDSKLEGIKVFNNFME